MSLSGTCSRLQVGAVLARDTRQIASGWNGAPPGEPHCDHDGSEASCRSAIHAERNVIGFAARYGIPTEETTLYVTHAPCWDCASVLIAAGISEVVYAEEYRSLEGVERLTASGIYVTRLRETIETRYRY